MNRNVLVLAFLGDAVYELYIRNYLLTKKIEKVNELQELKTNYVSAKAQEYFVKKMIEDNFLTEEEINIFKRGKNHKGSRHPKNTDLITYKYSTGLETLIGYLSLDNNEKRINEIMNFIISNDYKIS